MLVSGLRSPVSGLRSPVSGLRGTGSRMLELGPSVLAQRHLDLGRQGLNDEQAAA